MVDVNALLSPTGGSENGERLYSGFRGFVNFSISLGIEKLMTGTKAQSIFIKDLPKSRNTGVPRTFRQRRTTGAYLLNKKLSPTYKGGFSKEHVEISKRHINTETFETGSTHLKYMREKAGLMSRKNIIKGRLNDLNTSRQIFKGLGWALAMEWAGSLAYDLMSPKISAAADRSNSEVFTKSLADSGEAYTQRQRAMMAIHDSQSSITNVIGHEAMHFHK